MTSASPNPAGGAPPGNTLPPARSVCIGIISDIHYAGAAEQARGDDYEVASLANPLLRHFVRSYRRYFWLKQPLRQGYLLDRFLEQAAQLDYLVGNGDYSCDTACAGLSDEAARQSVAECVAKLRAAFGERLRLTFGDHELGKLSFFGGRGGMRLASWECAREKLGLEPFWRLDLGNYVLLGIVSSLVALPVFEPDILPEEHARWQALREEHLGQLRDALDGLRPEQRVLLFCHDPTALPFLWRERFVKARLPQLEHTVIGHLHSNLVLWKSRMLAGIPRITFLGHTVKRLSAALREARYWRPFRVRLCPALAGLELLKDGGFLTLDLDPQAVRPARFRFHAVPRGASQTRSLTS